MFKEVVKLRQFGVRLISTNLPRRTTEAMSVSQRDDYYKNLGDVAEKNDVKPPGWDEALPFEAIPGPKPLPLIGNIWRFLPFIGEYYNLNQKEIYKLLREKYGNIVIFNGIMGRRPRIIIFDVNDMEIMLRNAGPFPVRKSVESAVEYRRDVRPDIYKDALGVLALQGEEWFKFRSVVNPILMQPRAIQQYVGSMDKVASELIDNIRYFSTQNEKNEMPENFQNELYKWSLESVAIVALDRHLGCLNLKAPQDSEAHKLIASVNESIDLLYKLDFLPTMGEKTNSSAWKRFMEVSNYITDTTQKYVEEAVTRSITENTPDHQLSVAQRLAKIDKKIAIVMSMDMLAAGIDTTGKTLAAVLYFLARNPDKQQRLREELLKNLPAKNSPITNEILNKSPYLKAVIKESNRIAPVAVGNSRITVKDLVLAGYRIPKDTEIVSMNLLITNSDMFKDPEKFIPERWLRTAEDDYSVKNVHPFAYLPFGHGPRSCIGKRLANLELEVALSKVIRNFKLSWNYEDMVFSGTLLFGVDRPLKLTVKEV